MSEPEPTQEAASAVKRYNAIIMPDDCNMPAVFMKEDEDGYWVRAAQFQDLLSKCEGLEAERDESEHWLGHWKQLCQNRTKKLNTVESQLSAMREERDRLAAAISWAMGEGDSNFGDGERPKGQFWWRTELRKRTLAPQQPKGTSPTEGTK